MPRLNKEAYKLECALCGEPGVTYGNVWIEHNYLGAKKTFVYQGLQCGYCGESIISHEDNRQVSGEVDAWMCEVREKTNG